MSLYALINQVHQIIVVDFINQKNRKMKQITKKIVSTMSLITSLAIVIVLSSGCSKDNDELSDVKIPTEPFENPQYTMVKTLSDQAQLNTIAFDALGFMTGNLGSQTFLPPGKVADYNGFQYFRDNDQTNLGHNTSFVTIIASNILNLLTDEQVNMFVVAAQDQIDMINEYAYSRFPLCEAFRRLINNDIPEGTTGLNGDAVLQYSADLYEIDGNISYNRAELFGQVINSMSAEQTEHLESLKALNGIGNWPDDLPNILEGMNLEKDVNVAVMTFASEIYTWYAGSVTADTYFCPERQGTYFGSFYLKDWPAMGNPNYTINEQLTATAGQDFLEILNDEQRNMITGLVEVQKTSLTSLVEAREMIATELRQMIDNTPVSISNIVELSKDYGEFDGEIIYNYATTFSMVFQSLNDEQKNELFALADELGYIHPEGAFLYSEPIAMPEITNTDFLFE